MKLSLSVAAVLALGLGILDWREAQQVDAMRRDVERLALEARALELNPDNFSRRNSRLRDSNDNRKPDVATLVVAMTAISGRLGEISRLGLDWDAASSAQWQSCSAGIARLETGDLVQLLEGLRRSPGMNLDGFPLLAKDALMILAKERPQAALAFCRDSSGPGLPKWLNDQAIRSALTSWGATDPGAALAWLGQDHDNSPKDAADKRCAVFIGAGKQDARMAFSHLDDAPEELRQRIAWEMASRVENPAAAMTMLQSLKAYRSTNPGGSRIFDATLEGLGSAFENHTSFRTSFDEVRMTTDELIGFAKIGRTNQATSKWVQQLADKLPEGDDKTRVLKAMNAGS